MEIIENKSALEDYARFTTRVTMSPDLAESALRYNKITVVASPGESLIEASSGGLAVAGSMPIDLTPYLAQAELGELKNFVGIIKLQNDLSKLAEIYTHAERWGVTILFTSGASDYIRSNQLDLPSDKMYCWLTYSDVMLTDEVSQYAQKNNIGVMINQARDERVLFAVSRMIQPVGRVNATNSIINENVGGVIYVEQAHYLAEAGISCWVKSIQKTYPFSLFLGKIQAYAKYYDAIIEHEVREAVAQFVSEGRTMGQLEILRNVITTTLSRFVDQLDDEMEIKMPTLESMSTANRNAGIVDFVQISYTLLGELRVVNIII